MSTADETVEPDHRSTRSIAVVCLVALIGCAGTKPARAPVPVAVTASSSVERVAFTQCIDGAVLTKGTPLPYRATRFGFPLPTETSRAEALLKGGCALDGAIAGCRKLLGSKTRGSIDVDLTIGADGKVQTAKRASGTLPEDAFSECITESFRTAWFPAEAAGHARYRELIAGNVVTITEVKTHIWVIPPEVAKGVLRAAFPRIRGCYEQFLDRKKQHISGTLTFELELVGDGSLKSVHEDFTESFRDTELLECAAKAVASVTFPPFDGKRARIHYPLHLWSGPYYE